MDECRGPEICIHCEELRERIMVLEQMLGARDGVPEQFGFKGNPQKVLGMLLRREFCSKESMMTVLYGDQVLPPDDGVLAVMVCRLRKRLSPIGVEIETVWGQGWRMTAKSKRIFRNYMRLTDAEQGGSAPAGERARDILAGNQIQRKNGADRSEAGSQGIENGPERGSGVACEVGGANRS